MEYDSWEFLLQIVHWQIYRVDSFALCSCFTSFFFR